MSVVRFPGATPSLVTTACLMMLASVTVGCVPRSPDLAHGKSTFAEGNLENAAITDVTRDEIGRLARSAGFQQGDYLQEAQKLAPAGPYLPIPRGRPTANRSRPRGTFAPSSGRGGTFAPVRGRGTSWAQPGERGTWGQGALTADRGTFPASGDRGTFGSEGDFLPIRGAGSRNLPLGNGNVTFGQGQQWIQPGDRTTTPR